MTTNDASAREDENMTDLVEFIKARLDEDERTALAACYWPDDECQPGPFRHDRWVRRHVDETSPANVIRTATPDEGQATPGTSADPIPDGWVRTHEVAAIGSIGDSRLPEYTGQHIARHDPARVLREVEAKRRITDLHGRIGERWEGFPRANKLVPYCFHDNLAAPCPTLRLLALPYADHPDYREEWRA